MTTQDIINAIEDLIGLTYCSSPCEDVLDECRLNGEYAISELAKRLEKESKL